MIKVTKTFLPPLGEYIKYLEEIWSRSHITNHGPCVLELEAKLKEYLQVKHLFLVANGTIALQIAIKALGLKGEIITTPFSYIATTSSIVWENCTPVFADIDPMTLCIDPKKVEELITDKTSAVLATHVYGNPCAVDALEQMARRRGIKIIYDAAHAFGVKLDNRNILQWGDASTLSFHATKVFHTVEGGAITTDNDETAHRIDYMRNFGHNGPEQFWDVGINGKVSELHAAMGLVNFRYIDEIYLRRKKISLLYDELLAGLAIRRPAQPHNLDYNFSYYPIIFDSESLTLQIIAKMQAAEIFPRRYFYPSLNGLSYLPHGYATPVSEDITCRVLCLPLYAELELEAVRQISKIIRDEMQ